MCLLQGLYAKMVDAFKKMGLEVVPGVGTPFDPEVPFKDRVPTFARSPNSALWQCDLHTFLLPALAGSGAPNHSLPLRDQRPHCRQLLRDSCA